ncbi:META domain-containing protein [Flavivirga sp. 57AJ16]|uniref:META domain-containing protein n=1 Tax=Flavivirga sp. 57AJ16 TaxID=3025307 RepID=UPI002365FB44|nr:META domain-containing protein [Flavivirga sp. 57AJ16]MDD7886528.1 META domain-containing protein [Flavivirga sp. 57AJ16]
MKTKQILFITILSLVFASCASNKNEKLYNTTWELEYISGPRIAFEGLYPDKKPQISFNKETKKAEGNNSCNGYSADYTIKGDSISFGEPGPTTMMFCGNGEKVFLNMMGKINKYSFGSEGKLNLMIDNVPMMRFHKIQ